MTIYRVLVGKREYQVEVSDKSLRVNGEQVQANLVPLNEGGLYILRKGDDKREMHLHYQGNNAYTVLANGKHVVAQVEKENGKSRRTRNQNEAGDLIAPMPGMVVSVPVKEGEYVEKGQVLIVLESMKMQMEFKAPFAGQVVKLPVSPKTQVEKGGLLARVAGYEKTT